MGNLHVAFDAANQPQTPTIVLARRNGEKLGQLKAYGIVIKDSLNAPSELTFDVYKYEDGVRNHLWDALVDFKLIWCKELDTWFEAQVEINETNELIKTVFCKSICEAELGQLMLYNIEINTETDIARDDYERPTIFYDPDHPEASLIHRITEKAPHYTIQHIDSVLAKVQRTFSFDGVSIYDAFQEIATELEAIFVFDSGSVDGGGIARGISVYSLEPYCMDCGERGVTGTSCPKCGSTNLHPGYGNDTTVFITADEIAENIKFSTDVDSVKNCFRLEGGDDLMTATIRNCNPNGSDYIWYIPECVRADMSPELVEKLALYDKQYQYYQSDYAASIDPDLLSRYNALVGSYQSYNSQLENIKSPIIGYPALMNAYYDAVTLSGYLQSELMPTPSMSKTSAAAQAALLTASNLSPVAVSNLDSLSAATADNAVLGMARSVVDARYQVKVQSSTLSGYTWRGSFSVVNYSDETDAATSATVSVSINSDYQTYVEQRLKKLLHDDDSDNDALSITDLFKLNEASFRAQLKRYCLDSLKIFQGSCQSCIDILIEQGTADKDTWESSSADLYSDLYLPYYQKLQDIEAEIKKREEEIEVASDLCDAIIAERNSIQRALDFEAYLGEDLWKEFCSYRREDLYSNDNYISDGLSDAELFSRASELIQVAMRELMRSAEMQHSISSSLYNLLVIEKFRPLTDYFAVGNWLRVRVDEQIYKLRLLDYEIDFDNLENLTVTFSDMIRGADGMSDLQSVLAQAGNMATSYGSVKRQAGQGAYSDEVLSGWFVDGLDATHVRIVSNPDNQEQTWDKHGMLFRAYDPITDDYSDKQLKIINSTIAVTNDKWETTKTAFGNFYYRDPVTGEYVSAFGVNGEVVVGRLLLGERLRIHNDTNSLIFDENGMTITNGINSYFVNPNSNQLLRLSNAGGDILYVDNKGVLHITGDGAGLDISSNNALTGMSSRITQTEEKIEAEVSRATGAESSISSTITQTADQIRSEVKEVKDDQATLSSTITQTASQLRSEMKEVKDDQETLSSTVTQTASQLSSEISRATGAESSIGSRITQLANSITLSVSNGSLGHTASISLSVDGSSTSRTLNLSNVKQAFANDTSQVSVEAGKITFTGGTLVITTGNFGLTSDGTITASAGSIAGWQIGSGCLYRSDPTTAAGDNYNKSGTIYFGKRGLSISDGFRVNGIGSLNCYNAHIRGGLFFDDFFSDPSAAVPMAGKGTDSGDLFFGNAAYETSIRGSSIDLNSTSISAHATIRTVSDERLKKDWITLDKYDGFFDSLEPRGFRMIADGENGKFHTGFSAQKVRQALLDNGLQESDFSAIGKIPFHSDDPEYAELTEVFGLAYEEFVALSVDQIQKSKKKIQEQENRIQEQENRIQELEARLAALEAAITGK